MDFDLGGRNMASEDDELKISYELTEIFRRIKNDIPESAWAAVDDVWAGLKMVVSEINRAARGESSIKALYEKLSAGEPLLVHDIQLKDESLDGKAIFARREYLAEYDRYVEKTIAYDRKFRVLVCVMKDITEEEKSRKAHRRF